MITSDGLIDLAYRIRSRPDGPTIKAHRYDPVAYTDAAIAQAAADGWLYGLPAQERERLRQELIRITQSDIEWIIELTRLDYE